MDWQLPVVALTIVLALAYLGLRGWRAWKGQGTSCGGCACGKKADAKAAPSDALISRDDLLLRLKTRGGQGGG